MIILHLFFIFHKKNILFKIIKKKYNQNNK